MVWFLLLLACQRGWCSRFTSAVRIKARSKIAERLDNTTEVDVFSCDQMCMQCLDGRNVMIQRQKTGMAHLLTGATVGLTAYLTGGVAAGVAGLTVSQLAKCTEIGFQFWHNRKALPHQPWTTQAFWGFANVDAGINRLKRWTDQQKRSSQVDKDALEACEELTKPVLWHKLAELRDMYVSGNASSESKETLLARKCLSHAQLCGAETTAVLNVNRLNPFVSVEMCSPPFTVDGKYLDSLPEQPEVLREINNKILHNILSEEDHRVIPQDSHVVIETPKAQLVKEVEVAVLDREGAGITTYVGSGNKEIINGGSLDEDVDNNIDLGQLPVPLHGETLKVVEIGVDGDSETLKAVSDVLGQAISKVVDQDSQLSDGQVNWVISRACQTPKQIHLCNELSEEERREIDCADRCCLEACNHFSPHGDCLEVCAGKILDPRKEIRTESGGIGSKKPQVPPVAPMTGNMILQLRFNLALISTLRSATTCSKLKTTFQTLDYKRVGEVSIKQVSEMLDRLDRSQKQESQGLLKDVAKKVGKDPEKDTLTLSDFIRFTKIPVNEARGCTLDY